MFWKRRTPPPKPEPMQSPFSTFENPKTREEQEEEAAGKLADSLKSYSEAAYHASQPGTNAELETAYEKVERARKLVLEGKIAYALGQCLPEHIKHWPAWSQREDF